MRGHTIRGALLLAAALIASCGGEGGADTTLRSATGEVSGRALDASGAPISGRAVELCTTSGASCETATTDGQGAFRFVAPAAVYTLSLAGAEGEPTRYYQSAPPPRFVAGRSQASVFTVTEGSRDLGDIATVASGPAPAAGRSSTPASSEATPTRVRWLDGEWFLLGVNLPWVHWSCDFGAPSPQQPESCEPGDSVSDSRTQQILAPRFQELQARGVHVVRWWVFPDHPWQIEQDEAGLPARVADSVYEDFDAALELAEQYDLYFVFTLFSRPSALPERWLDDPAARELLADSLRPLFARYADSERLLSWQVFNEPEWEIWGGSIDLESARATVGAIADAVHASSRAYVSVGSATLDGVAIWTGLGLDYYTAHWYDPMTGTACAICTTYEEVRRRNQLDAPLVIGEHFAAEGDAALERLIELYERGYAGAWAWSLLPEFTNDQMAVDLEAMGEFASGREDVGP